MKKIWSLSLLVALIWLTNATWAGFTIQASGEGSQRTDDKSRYNAKAKVEAYYVGPKSGSIQVGIRYEAECQDSSVVPASHISSPLDTYRPDIVSDAKADDHYTITGNHRASAWNVWIPGEHQCDLRYKGIGSFSKEAGGFGISIDGYGLEYSFQGGVENIDDGNTVDFKMIKPAQVVIVCPDDDINPLPHKCEYSPILLDLSEPGFNLVGVDDPVIFDLNADGNQDLVSWTEGGEGDAFLVLDRNENGLIDNGGELFGNYTVLADGSTAEQGYIALAELDLPLFGGNGNGYIDSEDDFYWILQLWIDENHDGISDEAEMSSLWDAGVVAIDTAYEESVEQDEYGNRFAYLSSALLCADADCGQTKTIMTTDVFFLTANSGGDNHRRHKWKKRRAVTSDNPHLSRFAKPR